MRRNLDLDKSFNNARLWRQEAIDLRAVILESGLTEEIKWGKPCYTRDDKNICIIQRMNDFLALLFFKGALLKDPDGVLEEQGPHSRAGYRIRFTSPGDVARLANGVKACIRQAIEVETSGRKLEKAPEPEYPEELLARFDEDPEFRAAFDKLTPGRKRGYLLHFTDARRAQTRIARIDRSREKILRGKGLQDR